MPNKTLTAELTYFLLCHWLRRLNVPTTTTLDRRCDWCRECVDRDTRPAEDAVNEIRCSQEAGLLALSENRVLRNGLNPVGT